MNRRLFLKQLVATTAVGIVAPEYLVRGKSQISVSSFNDFQEFYFNTEYLDLSVEANRKIFLTPSWNPTRGQFKLLTIKELVDLERLRGIGVFNDSMKEGWL